MIKTKELKDLSKEELSSKLDELQRELLKLRAQVATGTAPKNTMQLRNTKKIIAKVLAIMNTK